MWDHFRGPLVDVYFSLNVISAFTEDTENWGQNLFLLKLNVLLRFGLMALVS